MTNLTASDFRIRRVEHQDTHGRVVQTEYQVRARTSTNDRPQLMCSFDTETQARIYIDAYLRAQGPTPIGGFIIPGADSD